MQLVVASLSSVLARAQTLQTEFSSHPSVMVRQWTAHDGLPVSGVNALTQDEDGFLWLATLGGVVRFDGRNFTVFDTGSNPELPNNRFVLMNPIGHDHFLLVAEGEKALYFDKRQFVDLNEKYGFSRTRGFETVSAPGAAIYTERGVLYVDTEGQGTFADTDLDAIYGGVSAEDGTVWLGGINGLTRRSPDGQEVTFTTRDGLPGNNIRAMVLTHQGVFGASPSGAFIWKAGEVTHFNYRDAPGEKVVAAFVQQYKNQILFSTGRGWQRLEKGYLVPAFEDIGGESSSSAEFLSAPVPIIDSRGDFWYAVGGEVFRNGQWVFRSSGQVVTLQPDSDGGVWLGHNRLGLFLILPSLVETIGMPEGLPGENVYGMTPDLNGGMWIGLLDKGVYAHIRDGKLASTIRMGEPWAAAREANGTIWIGGERLCRVENEQCTEERIPGRLAPIRSIFPDSHGNLWLGTQTGLWIRRSGETSWESVSAENNINPWVRFVAETTSGEVLFATFGNGVGYLENDQVSFWTANEGLPSNNIRSILQISSTEIWVGTEDAGLVRVIRDPGGKLENARVHVIDKSDGLPDNSVHAMVKDESDNVWINSNRGIYRLNPRDVQEDFDPAHAKVTFHLIDDAAGMRNREGNGGFQSAGYLDETGNIRFPTQAGVAIVATDALYSTPPPKPVLTSIRTESRDLDEHLDLIDLPSHERSLFLEFSSPHFATPERLQYRYRLDGMITGWQNTDGSASIPLNNIPPGSRTLEIQSGLSGTWSSETLRLFVRRQASFEESYWFIIVLVGLGISSTALLFFGRIRLVRRRNEQLERVIVERTQTIQEQANRLAEMDDLKTRFFSNISHELRTPLTLIKGPVSKLLEDGGSGQDPSVTRQLDVIDRNVDRLSTLVNEILDLNDLEAGRLELSFHLGDMTAFIIYIVKLFEQGARDKGVELAFEGPGDEMMWTFDPQRLEHVLVNLVGNALKFTKAPGRILVSCKAEDSAIRIEVSDTGIGIDNKDLSRLFERFFRGDNSEQIKGSGIGLSLSRDLIEQHGGTLTVTSSKGVGSTFTVLLPKINVETSDTRFAGSSVDYSVSPRRTSSSPDLQIDHLPERDTILVAEDNPDLLRFLVDSLIDRFNILSATNGKDALDLSLDAIPDLILTDVMMPGMNGMELCTAVKESLATSHIPVIMLTAKGDLDSRTSGLNHGADVYLGKPFQTRELVAYIDSLLANRRRVQEAFGRRNDPDATERDPLTSLVLDTTALSGMDRTFITDVVRMVQDGLSDSTLNVDTMADRTYLSSRQFHRKVEALSGITPGDLVRRIRLETAVIMIEKGDARLKEIGFAVGFSSESGFRKAFKEFYGVAPSKWTPDKR